MPNTPKMEPLPEPEKAESVRLYEQITAIGLAHQAAHQTGLTAAGERRDAKAFVEVMQSLAWASASIITAGEPQAFFDKLFRDLLDTAIKSFDAERRAFRLDKPKDR